LIVANYDEAWEFRVHPSLSTPELVSKTKRKSTEKGSDALVTALRDLDAKATFRRFAVAGLENPASTAAKWAEFSPDCQLVVVGYEDPRFDVKYRTEFGRPKPWVQLGELKRRDYNFILDVAWSVDSQFLLYLETEERYSKSPRGMASAAIGHPIPLETLFVTTVEIASGKLNRVKLLTDVPYGTGFFDTARPTCHQR
jgi:hypothetical protein